MQYWPLRQFTHTMVMPGRIGQIQLKWLSHGLLVALAVTPPLAHGDTDTMTSSRHRFAAITGVMQVDVSGAAGSGAVIPAGPGTEYTNLRSPDSVDAAGWKIDYAYETGDSLPRWLDAGGHSSNLVLRASWARYNGDATAEQTVPAGQAETGLLFTRPPDPVAYFPGAVGLESSATTDVRYGQLELGVQWLQATKFLPQSLRFMPQVLLGWNQIDYQVNTRDSFDPALVSSDDYRDTRDQYMQQDLFKLQFGGQLEKFFGGRNQYSISGSAGLVTYVLKATLSSYEYVTLAGQTRLRWTGDGERGTYLGAEFGLGLAWQMTPAWRASIAANFSPWVPTASIVNPSSVGNPATRTFVATEREASTTLLAGLGYAF